MKNECKSLPCDRLNKVAVTSKFQAEDSYKSRSCLEISWARLLLLVVNIVEWRLFSPGVVEYHGGLLNNTKWYFWCSKDALGWRCSRENEFWKWFEGLLVATLSFQRRFIVNVNAEETKDQISHNFVNKLLWRQWVKCVFLRLVLGGMRVRSLASYKVLYPGVITRNYVRDTQDTCPGSLMRSMPVNDRTATILRSPWTPCEEVLPNC